MGRPKKEKIFNSYDKNVYNDFIKSDKISEQKLEQNLEQNIEVQKVMNEFNETKETEKGKKGRKKKEIVNENQENFTQSVTFSAHIVLNIFLSRMPKPAPLNEDEAKNFDLAFSNLAKKYYPSFERYGEEIAFLGCLTFIIIPRLDFEKILSRKKYKENIVSEKPDKSDIR